MLHKRVLLFFLFIVASIIIVAYVELPNDYRGIVIRGFRGSRPQTVIAKASEEAQLEETAVASPSSTSWDTTILETEKLLSNRTIGIIKNNTAEQQDGLPSCLLPNKNKTSALVRHVLQKASSTSAPLLPLPVMNLGLPKCGSTTLFEFFDCVGLQTSHWATNTPYFEGLCMRDAVNAGLPPIQTCGPRTDAFMQFDVEIPFGFASWWKGGNNFMSIKQRDDCFFPQLSLLDEIHAENPNVTFVMNFRPIHDWIKSVEGWANNMLQRFQACHLPNLPRGHPNTDAVRNNKDALVATMAHFVCSHVQHVRNFVEAYPSHALIELDLYDMDHSRSVMSALFPSSKKNSSECWGHGNKSHKK